MSGLKPPACRCDGPQTHDPKKIARTAGYFMRCVDRSATEATAVATAAAKAAATAFAATIATAITTTATAMAAVATGQAVDAGACGIRLAAGAHRLAVGQVQACELGGFQGVDVSWQLVAIVATTVLATALTATLATTARAATFRTWTIAWTTALAIATVVKTATFALALKAGVARRAVAARWRWAIA